MTEFVFTFVLAFIIGAKIGRYFTQKEQKNHTTKRKNKNEI